LAIGDMGMMPALLFELISISLRPCRKAQEPRELSPRDEALQIERWTISG
jgi:hypothetical protein